MPSHFPVSIDSTAEGGYLVAPTGTAASMKPTAGVPPYTEHALNHNYLSDIIIAIETKVGTSSGAPPGTISNSITKLFPVTISNLATGDYLVFDGMEWINVKTVFGDGGLVV